MFIGLESQFLDICKKIVPALHRHYGYQPHWGWGPVGPFRWAL